MFSRPISSLFLGVVGNRWSKIIDTALETAVLRTYIALYTYKKLSVHKNSAINVSHTVFISTY